MAIRPPPTLSVTSLSQYVRYNNCDRFLRLRLRPDEEEALRAKWNLTIQPLTPLLREQGLEFEKGIERAISARGEAVIRFEENDAAATITQLREVQEPTVLLQPPVSGTMGHFAYTGRADVVRAWRDKQGALNLYIADIKASRAEKTEHRLQVAAYARLLRQMAEGAGLAVGAITGGVLHIQEGGDYPTLDPAHTFDLDTYFTILDKMAMAPDSTAARIAALPFAEAPYHLGFHCDGCLYNAICMYDSAERGDLSLVPHLKASEKRMLKEQGVRTVQELAALMTLPAQGEGYNLRVAPDQAETVDRLKAVPQLAVKLPILVQRAKRAAKRFDPAQDARSYLLNSGFGTLPDQQDSPGLVKIFFDAQHDYLRDRVYMVAGLVKGPRGEQVIIEMMDAPGGKEEEQTLLTRWVAGVLMAVREVAAGESAPIHLYCFNTYDQRTLLEALKRHLDAVAGLPGFFDLMTQHPALSQPIISFLARELELRVNLGSVCAPLHTAARQLGFDWRATGVAYDLIFRARIFDNRRDIVRAGDGTIHDAPDSVPHDDPRRIPIESASRFTSQIPLEYAYAAWGRLPESQEDRGLLRPFRAVIPEQLHGFAAQRVRALAHIEGWLKKARFIDKPGIDLTALAADDAPDTTPAQSLREFLFMEHHAALQAKLQTFALPIERRVQTGLALLLRCSAVERDEACFEVAFEELDLGPELVMNGLRLKEDGWVLLNTHDPANPTSANKLKHGRLAIVEAVEEKNVRLRLLSITFKGSRFRYYHDYNLTPTPGQLYTMDEMADDINADKALAALDNISENVFYKWLLEAPAARHTAPALRAEDFANIIHQVEKPHRLTAPQQRIIGGRLDAPLLLVQGPPGTGKSHTIGWAVIYRMMNAAATGQPFRVAVVCKTHNAVNIVLESIARKYQRLLAYRLKGMTTGIPLFKLVNNEDDEAPAGVLRCVVSQSAAIDRLFDEPWLVAGGTPGGHYSAAKNCRVGGNNVDWEHKRFDLLVIDEASQMSVPEGLLAGAWLRQSGTILVVGDHRQMPPIVAHEWETEEKRTVATSRPYLSLFETLLERGFARESLDESFRLHKEIAHFLQENIYVRDDIRFFSRRTWLLDAALPASDFVDPILDPRFPIVVVEHDENASQQYNILEMHIVARLLEAVAGLRLDDMDGVGVVVPHRAQRAMLRQMFPALAAANGIDTVERFQGGERDLIIVSATASDPDYVLAEAEFLLNLNRLNVALSRPRKKLIVVAGRAVTQLIVSDLAVFEHAVLWKRLYYQFACQPLWEGQVDGIDVRVRGRSAHGAAA